MMLLRGPSDAAFLRSGAHGPDARFPDAERQSEPDAERQSEPGAERQSEFVGWSVANPLRAELVLAAMEMAIGQRGPKDVIHHGDQGSQ